MQLVLALALHVYAVAAINLNTLRNDALSAHNQLRAKHSAPSLQLTNQLNNYAQSRAANLAARDNGQLSHDGLASGYGENLHWVRGQNPSGRSFSQQWYDEIRYYNYNNPGFSSGTGHFTQLVWRSSRQVGFGAAQGRSGTWYVSAIYTPRGNMEGQFRQNVL